MIFWHAVLVGWIVFWKQGVEKTIESAFAYETNVANLHRLIWVTWTWLPQSMSVLWIFDGQLFAEKYQSRPSRIASVKENNSTPVYVRQGSVT